MAFIAMLLMAAAAQAGDVPAESEGPAPLGRMAVLGIGRCEDPRLGQAVRSLRAELRLQRGADVLSEEETASPAGGLLRLTLEDCHRAIDAARSRFFGLDYGTAEAMLRKVLPEIDRLPPGPDRWDAWAQAHVELAQVLAFNLKRGLAGDLLLEVLRLQEDFELDRHRYPPLLRDEVDRARRLLQKARRFTLRVQSPSSYPVFLNGREMGTTPFERALVEGEYEVIVGDPAAHSFPRRVELHSDREVLIEVLPEARFRVLAGPCFDADPIPEERAAAAGLMASALPVEQVILVRLEKSAGEERVIAGLLPTAGGRELREGRQRSEGGAIPRLRNLATYVLTGDASVLEERLAETAMTSSAPFRDEPVAPKKRIRRLREVPPAATAMALMPGPAPGPAEAGFPWLRAGGFAMGAAAVGLGAAAIVEYGQMSRAREEIQRLASGSAGGFTRDSVIAIGTQVTSFQSAKELRNGFAIGAAAAAVASGGLLGLSFLPGKADGPAGAVVTVAGRF